MIIQNLYQEALINPILEGADKLNIISGYATSAMASRHIEEIKNCKKNIDISLLIGMSSKDGLSVSNHYGFKKIMESSEYSKNFTCSYIFERPPVHSKAYIWFKNGDFYKSFIGSANYTQNAFSTNQMEILSLSNKKEIVDYYNFLEQKSIYCNHNEVETHINIYNDKDYYRTHTNEEVVDKKGNIIIPDKINVENFTISLLGRNGKIQKVGGLNWGQRDKRNPNQAYLQLPPEVYRSNFFPPKPKHFTVVTDDSKILICTRAQKDEYGQTIHTPHNNSFIGEYFRNRLGLEYGAFVHKDDLERYGRTTVTFYKFDEENYYMDFSV